MKRILKSILIVGCTLLLNGCLTMAILIARGDQRSVYHSSVYGTVTNDAGDPLGTCSAFVIDEFTILNRHQPRGKRSKIESQFDFTISSFEKPKNVYFSIDCDDEYEIFTSKPLSRKNYHYDPYIEGEGININIGNVVMKTKRSIVDATYGH